MKNITLNKNSNIIRYHNWVYNTYTYEYNFCIFFWKLMFALLVAPLIWLSYPFDLTYKQSIGTRIWYSVGVLFGLVLTGAVFGTLAAYHGAYNILTGLLIVAGIILAVILSVAVVVGGIALSVEVSRDVLRKSVESNTVTALSTIFLAKKDSFMNKYCPKINWK